MKTPGDWERVDSSRVAPFENSREVYRLPDGSEYVWESRRHRKGRGPRSATGGAAQTADGEPESGSRDPWLEFYAPRRLSWWIAVAFVTGSVLFTLGAASSLAPSLFAGEGSLVTDASYFAGALLFTGGIYLQLLEGLNVSDYIGLGRSYRLRRFTWFAWRPRRLEFVAPFVLLVGSALFNFETSLALFATLFGATFHVLVGSLSALGSLMFVIATYLQLVEVCHRYLCFRPREISWWVAVFNLVGSVGFLVGSVFGFEVLGLSSPEESTITTIGFFAGSALFLIGSYLLLPEMFSE